MYFGVELVARMCIGDVILLGLLRERVLRDREVLRDVRIVGRLMRGLWRMRVWFGHWGRRHSLMLVGDEFRTTVGGESREVASDDHLAGLESDLDAMLAIRI